MKTGYIIFIATYIISLFFCIFARVESWPFSDYRVFQGASYPEQKIVYVPHFKLSNGEYFNPGTKRLHLQMDRYYFDNVFRKFQAEKREIYIKQLIHSKEVKEYKERMIENNLYPVKFIVMKVSFKKRKGRRLYVPNFTTEKEYDLD